MSQYVTFLFKKLKATFLKSTFFYQILNQLLKISIYTHDKYFYLVEYLKHLGIAYLINQKI